MKILKKAGAGVVICMLILQSIFISGLTTLADGFSPIQYELYDYFEDVETARAGGTAVVSDSPWSVQAKLPGGDWTSPGSTYDTDGDYVYVHGIKNGWGNYPGYAYNYPADRSERYYQNYITPTNSSGDAAWHIDMAYTFTAPESGYYRVGQCIQDKSTDFTRTNYFRQLGTDGSFPLELGVRITVNGETIWNGDVTAEKRDGFAVFGAKTAQNSRIAVPTLENLNLKFGDVVRVEFTNFTPTKDGFAQQINGIV